MDRSSTPAWDVPSQLGFERGDGNQTGLDNTASFVRMSNLNAATWSGPSSTTGSIHSLFDDDEYRPGDSRMKVWAGLAVVFFANAGLSVVTPSLWFYLENDFGETNKLVLGLVIAAFNLGQVLGAPFLEKWAQKRNAKEVLMASLLLTAIGEFWYALANNLWFIPASRFLTGFGAANQSVVQYFVGSIVPPEERESRMRHLALISVLSFAIGPGIGAGLTLLDFKVWNIEVNQYNIAGFFSGIMALLNLVIVTLCISIHDTEPQEELMDSSALFRAAQLHFVTHVKPLLPLLMSIVVVYFFVFNAGAVFEAMITPFTELNFGWGVQENEILWMGCGSLSLVAFLSLPAFSQFFNDRQILTLFLTLLTAGFGSLIYLGDSLPLWRFIVGIILISYSFPGCMAQCISVYAQVLSAPPQGVTLWLLTGGGVAARLLGPIWSGNVVDIHEWKGVFIGTTAGLVFAMIIFLACFKKIQLLISYNDPRSSRVGFGSFHSSSSRKRSSDGL